MLSLLSPGASRDTTQTMRLIDGITAVTVGIGALEEITRHHEVGEDSLHSWTIRRTAWNRRFTRLMRPVLALSSQRWDRANAAVRLAAAAIHLAGPRDSRLRLAASAATASAFWIKSFRQSYGSDGSDQIVFLTSACTTLARLPGLPAVERERALDFIGAQSLMSYTVAGAAKTISPQWRDGSALPGIMRTQTYGDAWLYRILKDRPWLCRAMCWTVIAVETGAPLMLLAPPPVRRGYLAVLGGFHVANARHMGLNRFLWAFVGTYPAVDRLGRRPAVQR